MGFWDDLWKRVQETGDAVKEEATKRAAAAAVDRLKGQVESAADDALGAAEKELAEAQQAREGRTEYRPAAESGGADSIISSADAMLRAHRTGQPAAAPTTSYAEQRKARQDRARAELEALKARLQADGALEKSAGKAEEPGEPSGDKPIKRTL